MAEDNPAFWSETDDPQELARRKKVLEEQVEASDLPYTLTAGCLCGKTTVECGDCHGLVAHQEATLQKAGWCSPSEAVYRYQDVKFSPEFPAISVIRGGILHPRFVVEARVDQARKRFLRRQTWSVRISYYDVSQNRFMEHFMEGFPSAELANNAAEIIRFTMKSINEQYHEEKRRAR